MPGEQERRHVYYDRDLKIEAYNLSGVVQKFPNHFHEYYVIGFLEGGKRHLWCKGREYDLVVGDLVLFNPKDNHYCQPVDGSMLDYRAVNISREVMAQAAGELMGRAFAPYFTKTVLPQSDSTARLRDLYDTIVTQAPGPRKDKSFVSLLEQILKHDAVDEDQTDLAEPNRQIKALCAYLEQHYAETITLEEMLSMTSFGKSNLIRAFTKQIGVSPYRYLQTVRLEKAKKLLEEGVAPAMVGGILLTLVGLGLSEKRKRTEETVCELQ